MPSRFDIEAFLAAPRIAVVGVSRNPKSFTNAVYRHLRDGDRQVVPVNPAADEIEGDRCHPSVGAVPGEVDGVLVMVDRDTALDVVDDCVAAAIPIVWLHKGAGPGAVSDEAVERCRSAGVTVIDGACPLMFAEPVGMVHRIHRLIAGRRIAA